MDPFLDSNAFCYDTTTSDVAPDFLSTPRLKQEGQTDPCSSISIGELPSWGMTNELSSHGLRRLSLPMIVLPGPTTPDDRIDYSPRVEAISPSLLHRQVPARAPQFLPSPTSASSSSSLYTPFSSVLLSDVPEQHEQSFLVVPHHPQFAIPATPATDPNHVKLVTWMTKWDATTKKFMYRHMDGEYAFEVNNVVSVMVDAERGEPWRPSEMELGTGCGRVIAATRRQ
jgi:hypothetical protein